MEDELFGNYGFAGLIRGTYGNRERELPLGNTRGDNFGFLQNQFPFNAAQFKDLPTLTKIPAVIQSFPWSLNNKPRAVVRPMPRRSPPLDRRG